MLFKRIQKKLIYSALLLATLLTFSKLQAQVVINEIRAGGTVELKNIGAEMVDVSDYLLCDFPAYDRLSNLNVICGSLDMAPGSILAIDNFNFIDASDGEMGLYLNNSYTNPESILDYVEWGSTGHQRSSVAVAAQIWSTGDFVPAFGSDQSLAYSGTGDGIDSWTASTSSSICDENTSDSCDVEGGEIMLENGETSTSICVDGVGDPLNVTVSGSDGPNDGWIVTDDENNILGLPAEGPFDFDGAGPGTCLIWYIRYDDGLTGKEEGNNLEDLEGCFDLSNAVTVIREEPDGGMVSLADGEDELVAFVGDIVFDMAHTTTANNLSYWYIITDADDTILGFHNSADGPTIDLSDAPTGECRIWGWSYRGLDDPVLGENISTLTDDSCEAISENFVNIVRLENTCNVDGGEIELENGETLAVICVDGVGDPLNVSVSGSEGTNGAWIITDTQNNILGLPAEGPFDLDGAGPGTCLIWYIRYEDGLLGKEMGNTLDDLEGCYDLSNAISVVREEADGGMVSLSNGEDELLAFVGDIVFDMAHTTTANNLSYWYIITDADDSILGFHNSADGPTIDLSEAPVGECRIWGWSYRGLDDPILGENISTLTDDSCEAISENFVNVVRQENTCEVEGGEIALENGETSAVICVDGIGDPLNVDVNGSEGPNGGWIITDTEDNILGLPAEGPFDLDGAGVGTCLIWYIRYEDGLTGKEVGNSLSDLDGCYDLSNPITVFRDEPDGGFVSLADGSTAYSGTAGDIVFDMKHYTEAEYLSYWYIITDDNDNILGFHNAADGPTLDLSEAPPGECRIWGWSYRGLDDPIMGEHISSLTDDPCETISENFVPIFRQAMDCEVEGGEIALESGETTTSICVDGVGDPLNVNVSGSEGPNGGWIITDLDNNILGLPAEGPFDLDGAGPGSCLIWYIRYEDGLMGKEMGNTLSDLEGCFDLSNAVTVIREEPDGGRVSLANGDTEYANCAGDIIFEMSHETTAENLSYWYIITDANDDILGWHNSADGPTIDLSDAPAGECRIWGWSYRGLDDPIMGENISTLADDSCEAISENWVTIFRETPDGGVVSTSSGETSIELCVGEVIFTVQHETSAPNLSYWYIITDANDDILAFHNSKDGDTLDLSAAPAGKCHIWGWNYKGLDDPIIGENIATLGDDFCEAISENWITVNRVETGDACGVSSTSEIESVSEFKVFPNPVFESVNVAYSDLIGGRGNIALIDAQGRTLLTQNVNNASGSIVFNVSSFSNGLYMVRITGEEGISTRRLVVLR